MMNHAFKVLQARTASVHMLKECFCKTARRIRRGAIVVDVEEQQELKMLSKRTWEDEQEFIVFMSGGEAQVLVLRASSKQFLAKLEECVRGLISTT